MRRQDAPSVPRPCGHDSAAEGAGLSQSAGSDSQGRLDALILPIQKHQGEDLLVKQVWGWPCSAPMGLWVGQEAGRRQGEFPEEGMVADNGRPLQKGQLFIQVLLCALPPGKVCYLLPGLMSATAPPSRYHQPYLTDESQRGEAVLSQPHSLGGNDSDLGPSFYSRNKS